MSKRAEIAALKAYSKGPTVNMGYEDYDQYSKERSGFIEGYEQAEKDTIKRAIKWLMDRVNIPYDVETNDDGEPLADSYIDYAKKRFEVANEIVEDFRKAMEEE